jgi:hypothetical protein
MRPFLNGGLKPYEETSEFEPRRFFFEQIGKKKKNRKQSA